MDHGQGEARQLAVSFIVDSDPIFAYTGWYLAHSLAENAEIPWPNIHVQFTPEVPARTIDEFRRLGCSTHRLERFGDGKYCNKLGQWENLRGVAAEHFLLLDTDMICVADLSQFLSGDAISAKVVDFDNPRLPLLDLLFERAGFTDRPPTVPVEGRDAFTFRGNSNGGCYSIPRRFAEPLFEAWRRHALRLLDDIEPLRAAGKESHVDQVAFCIAIHETGLPFAPLPSNANYYLHVAGPHPLRESERPISLIHYHNDSVDVLGLLNCAGAAEPDELAAVSKANEHIRANFNTRLFWEMRYARFPDRGSGIGSRGQNLTYKRDLLRSEGVETAESVLDVGCGDLEVVRELALSGYVGLDQSAETLKRAAALRPDWTFVEAGTDDPEPAEFVLCFEVAIHQATLEEYCELISFLARKTQRTLIVSGYDEATDKIRDNHMTYFHEPLASSLKESGRFSTVRKIGAHSGVVVYRCDI